MIWIPDENQEFAVRPFFEKGEIDAVCEKLVLAFLNHKYDKISFPLKTEDLCTLIEQQDCELDQYADLSGWGSDVQGMTQFYKGRETRISISKSLDHYNYENRRRTTMTHELSHAVLQKGLIEMNPEKFSAKGESRIAIVCHRKDVERTPKRNWKEWQANYGSGAFLMPQSHVKALVEEMQKLIRFRDAIFLKTNTGFTLLSWMQNRFYVSSDAARVRLLQLGYVTEKEPTMQVSYY